MSSFQIQSSEVLARLKPFGISFEKSLSDLIKGIRSNSKESPESLQAFLNAAIVECKNELNTTDLETKAMAVLKLSYLEMYGFDMSWCNFQILEVTSSNKFQQKRVGYLAAIQSFKSEQDLLILATNQFKKDLNSHNHIEIGLALSGIATIVTPNLSRDINDDVLMKLTHSKPYIRKKAVLAMYKIFLQYPDSLRMNFNRIIEMLDDADVAVVSATINVICEISKKNPKIFINHLPRFFLILEDTKNNWLIIRILKLFQSLSKVEPRMKKKILPTIMDLMLKTQASSLIYECINCIVNGQMLSSDSSKDKETAKICIERIMNFFQTRDSNLKFVGLLALINILKIFPSLMHKLKGVSGVVMDCLTDEDLIIKRKALEICQYLVTEKNITELVKVLLLQLIANENGFVPDNLKLEITSKILSIASKDNYSLIPNFKWYVAVLNDIINLTLRGASSSNISSSQAANNVALQLGSEIKTLATRVPSIRPHIINEIAISLAKDATLLDNSPVLLKDVYWTIGEFVDEFGVVNKGEKGVDENSEDESVDGDLNEFNTGSVEKTVLGLGKMVELFNAFVNFKYNDTESSISNKLLTLGNQAVLSVFIQCLVKLFNGIVLTHVKLYGIDGRLKHKEFINISFYLYKLIKFLENWENHSKYEVQERALSWLEFLKICLEAMTKNDLKEVLVLESEEIEYHKNLIDLENESHISDNQSDYTISESNSESGQESGSSESDNSLSEENDVDDQNSEKYEKHSKKQDSMETMESIDDYDSNHQNIKEDNISTKDHELPALMTSILPSFFKAYALNPISINAQKNIMIPEYLDIDTPLITLSPFHDFSDNDDDSAYNLFVSDTEVTSDSEYSNEKPNTEVNPLKVQERLERLKDDPYYITGSDTNKGKSKYSRSKGESKKERTKSPSVDTNEISPISTNSKKKSSSTKKLKKEKVLILSEETVGDETTPVEFNVQTVKPKRKDNVLKIDSSNLDNFDLHSSISDITSTDELGKNYEYKVDLEELRQKLAESSMKTEEKKKKKKKKSKKESRTNDDLKNAKSEVKGDDLTEQNSEKTGIKGDINTENSKSNAVKIVKHPKKTKKKSKAVIID